MMNHLLKLFWTGLHLVMLLRQGNTDNVATDAVSYLQGPENGSFFGYTVVPQREGKRMTLWVGAPKYSPKNVQPSSSTAKQGAIFSCQTGHVLVNDHEVTLNLNETQCVRTELKVQAALAASKNNSDSGSKDEMLPEMALESCDFENEGFCGFTLSPQSDFNWTRTNRSGSMQRATRLGKIVNPRYTKRICGKYPNRRCPRTRITGPASYTVNDWYLNADSNLFPPKAAAGTSMTTILVSPGIRTRKGLKQCLRFCFNAYALKPDSKRRLKVYMEYASQPLGKRQLYLFDGQKDFGSGSWNYTEVNITSEINGFYKIYFEATVFKFRKRQRYGLGDIVLTDINVANLHCGEELRGGDELVEEQSIGLTLESTSAVGGVLSMAACGPLWQHDCGYAKEANGVCYEMKTKNSKIIELKRHNPISQACIRGLIDIVMVVDQSGSVNQCNFQKVKRWLRDIIRGFNIGKTEQDVGVVVYSSEDKTRAVVDLGFEKYNSEGKQKFQDMIQTLRNLPFESGQTYTGSALHEAHRMLFGPKARSEAKKMIILLTDGATTKADREVLERETEIAKANDVTILAVGVGNYDTKELINIAGSKNNFFAVKKFSELAQVRNKLRGSVSQGNLEGSGNANTSSENLQQCQLGFSIHLSETSLMMGGPGCYDQYGDVITYNASQSTSEPFTVSGSGEYLLTRHHHSGDDDEEDANVTASDATSVLEKEKENHKFEDYDVPTVYQIHHALSDDLKQGYFGYAINSGMYFGAGEDEYNAVSAPRWNGSGAVLVYFSLTHDFPGKHKLLIPGLQFGEYFGASLTTNDVNTDGFDDLLVGAPLHSTLKQADEGRVYLYMGGKNMSKTPDRVLRGSQSAFSRFGSVISALGDINLDGYRDIAVTALTEDGTGVVYIFHGHHEGIDPTPAQRIHPKTLKPEPSQPLRKFGQSVAGQFDVDGNGYPDILIGSPGSDTVAILLSRPVIYVNVKSHPDKYFVSRSRPCEGPECFKWNICFSYRGVSVPDAIVIKYEIKLDVAHDVPRVFFASTQTSELTANEEIHRYGATHCTGHVIKVKAQIRDIMTPVQLHLKYDMGDFDEVNRYSGDDFVIDEAFFGPETSTPGPRQSTVMYQISRPVNQSEKAFHAEHQSPLSAVVNMHDENERSDSIPFRTACENVTMCRTDLQVEAAIRDIVGNVLKEIIVQPNIKIKVRLKIINGGKEDGHGIFGSVHYSEQLVFNALKGTRSTDEICCVET